jgi:hypothetical protein
LYVSAGKNGIQGYSGDNGKARAAELHAPIAIYWDRETKRKFIAEVHKCTIRMIDPSGKISTIAGIAGNCGMDVDGLAKTSRLFQPFALSMNSIGHLVIADFGNNRIVELTIGGDMKRIAGGGSSSLESTSDNELAVNTNLSSPSGIWVDQNDNIYIAETFGHRVRQVKADDKKIYDVVGAFNVNGTQSDVWHPRGIWGDDNSEYKLYIPDSLNHRVVALSLRSPSPNSEHFSQRRSVRATSGRSSQRLSVKRAHLRRNE